MRKNFIKNYALVMTILFVIYNLILQNLKIGGSVYQTFMFLLIIINGIILIIFKKQIKHKDIVIIIYSLVWIFSKNTLQCLFNFSNIIILCITGFMENNFIKVISLFLAIFVTLFFLPLYFIYLLIFGVNSNNEKEMNDIYTDTHYCCNNNYEAYAYSAGAMDSFHYNIGKHYEIININDILYISYKERNETTQEEYENYIEKNNCKLVGENNESN